LKTLTIILTDGPYISEYAEMAYKIASEALKKSQVNIFLYLDAVYIPKLGQKPSLFADAGQIFRNLEVITGNQLKARPLPGRS
jgi:tRNA 2-thiouridine synthesizing protein D